VRSGLFAVALPAAIIAGFITPAFGQINSASVAQASVAPVRNYGKLPLSFEVNQGQVDPSVRFLSRGAGYALFLTDSSAVLAVARSGAPGQPTDSPDSSRATIGASSKASGEDVLRMDLAGSSHPLHVEGADRLPGLANYFIGNDPARWHSGVPTYAKVKYTGVYPGIDLIYYGNQSRLEYDFDVAPAADPRSVRLHFAGARRLTITGSGDLLIVLGGGEITLHKPEVYQTEGGARQTIQADFKLLAGNRVGFSIGRYDRAKPLVIDPVLTYSTYFGGANGGTYGGDYATGVAVDSSGNAYITGQAISANFPVTSGAYQTSNPGETNMAFVAKLNASGTALVYSTYVGGSIGQYAAGIAVDGSGNAYIAGKTGSYDFPVTFGAFETLMKNGNPLGNIFVTKLNAEGDGLVYSTHFGGDSNNDACTAIALDSTGNAYITGHVLSGDFPVTSGAFQTVANASNGYNTFITKLNPQGSGLVYSTYLGGSGSDQATSIAVSGSGIAYITGQTTSIDFPTSSGAFQTQPGFVAGYGDLNAFVTALNSAGTALVYSTYLGGNYSDTGSGIAVDSGGNAYVTGSAYSQNFPTTAGSYQPVKASPAIGNAFVTKVNPEGTALVYSTYLGGAHLADEHQDYGSAIAVDQMGDAFVTGAEESNDFPVTSGAVQATDPGDLNAFVTKLNPAGTALLYSTYLGGSQYDYGKAIAIDKSGDAFVAGQTLSQDFPTLNAYQSTNPSYTDGGSNAFVASLAIGDETTTALSSNANPQQEGDVVTFTAVVTPAFTDGVPTGSVVFSIDGSAAGTVALNGTGTAVYSSSALASGTHTIEAAYSGDTNYLASNATLTETIQGPAAAVLSLPSAGSVLSGTAATVFTWTAGTSVSSYELRLGTTGTGSDNLYNSGFTSALTATYGPLPTNGQTVYATLYSKIAGTWIDNTYTFTESNQTTPAVLTAPATGATLSGTAATVFTWSAGTGVSSYELRLGTTGAGSYNLYNSGFTSALTESVGPLPTNGLTVYATLYSKIGATWTDNTYTFKESKASAPAVLTLPIAGSVLSGSAATVFTWSAGTGVSSYELRLGTTGTGSDNLYNSGFTSALTATFGPLPASGQTVYATLYSKIAGMWTDSTYTFSESTVTTPAVLTAPAAGTTLSGTAATVFTWTTGSGVSSYELRLGTTGAGSDNLYNSGFTSALTATFGPLPTAGLTVYATLYSKIAATWTDITYTFTESSVLPQTESILYQFTGNNTNGTDGWHPNGGLVMDSQGDLYGTTSYGLTAGENAGTVFKVSPSGQETILHNFGGAPDGSDPNSGLVMDAQGNLYGTTVGGGSDGISENGFTYQPAAGTVFKIAPSGAETVLHSFPSTATDGEYPYQGLVIDSSGNVYGTTELGGNSTDCGTVFKVTPGGAETVFYSFSGPDGCSPGEIFSSVSNSEPGLVMDAKGSLYGTTAQGGANGVGTVFKLTASGTETVLHSFANDGTDGYEPNGGLALDSEGNLYGSTSAGGTSVFGIIFKIAPSGAESVLYNFNGNGLLGASPGLALDSHGNLYGTSSGDQPIPGVVFQLAPSGVMTFMHLFPGYPTAGDGTFPQGGLLLAANGSLYGTTSEGDVSSNSGTIFQLGTSVNPTPPPAFSVSPGTYTSPQTITITDAMPGATIYYSTGGAIASAYAGTVYYGPVTISSTALLSAIAVAPDGTASDPIMANYVVASAP